LKTDVSRIAERIETLATSRHRSQKEIREREFLDSIESVFTETIDMVSSDPRALQPIFEMVLKGIRLFTRFPLTGLILRTGVEDKPPLYLAGNLLVEDILAEPARVESVRALIAELRRGGPVVGGAAFEKLLPIVRGLRTATPELRAEEAWDTCLVPINGSGCEGALVLTSSRREHLSQPDTHHYYSEPGMRFLANLGHTLGEHVSICLDVSKVKRDHVNFRHLMISLAHEINTPIQSMIADAANIVDELSALSEVRRIAEHNLEEVDRLHLLSENIMAVLSERKKPKAAFSSHSIYRPLKEACEMFEGEAEAKGCNIVGPQSVGSDFPKMAMSLFDLTLAFKNLIHNAVKYSFYPPVGMERERFVKVTGRWLCEEDGRKYAIEIENYGVGIKPEEIEKGLIFEPFYRGDWASDRYRTGSGLGLTLARRVIEEMHGGQIKVRSIPMRGTAYLTIVTVILPV